MRTASGDTLREILAEAHIVELCPFGGTFYAVQEKDRFYVYLYGAWEDIARYCFWEARKDYSDDFWTFMVIE